MLTKRRFGEASLSRFGLINPPSPPPRPRPAQPLCIRAALKIKQGRIPGYPVGGKVGEGRVFWRKRAARVYGDASRRRRGRSLAGG